jgi:hypothetical protein
MDLENRALRRENNRLGAELAAARARIRRQEQALDDLLDWTSGFYSTGRPGVVIIDVWACHDPREQTPAQAHVVMQQHRECLTADCTARRTAVRTLRDAGHLVPDSARPAPLLG